MAFNEDTNDVDFNTNIDNAPQWSEGNDFLVNLNTHGDIDAVEDEYDGVCSTQ
jgi:hypothetical protein